MEKLDERLTTVEHRVSTAEDRGICQERALGYLLKRDAKLTAKQKDLENRLRCNNIRVYGIPEEAEGKEMVPFLTKFFRTTLELQEGVEIKLERSFCTETEADDSTKVHNSKIFRLPHKASDEVREVIKKLREKNIMAQSPYPAQLNVFLDTGTKVFPSLLEMQLFLKELGMVAEMEERDVLERELTQDMWVMQDKRRRKSHSRQHNSHIRAIWETDAIAHCVFHPESSISLPILDRERTACRTFIFKKLHCVCWFIEGDHWSVGSYKMFITHCLLVLYVLLLSANISMKTGKLLDCNLNFIFDN